MPLYLYGVVVMMRTKGDALVVAFGRGGIPVTETHPGKSKKGRYFIKDNFFRFWFSYVLPYKSQLELGNTAYVMERIKANFSGFVAKVYEDLVVDYLLRNYPVLKAGRWWSREDEIDVVGIGEGFMIVGECKYSNKKVGIDILEMLERKSQKIETALPVTHYLLFSKSGFTEALLEVAKRREDVVLIAGL